MNWTLRVALAAAAFAAALPARAEFSLERLVTAPSIMESLRISAASRPGLSAVEVTPLTAQGWDKSKVRRFAQALAVKAPELLEAYRANSKTGNWLEKASRERALNALEPFRVAAVRFDAAAQGRHPTRFSTEGAYRDLESAYAGVQATLPGAYRFSRVSHLYGEVVSLMAQLEPNYR